jgi:uncharacterized repeat protein (TIGR03806 family)
MRTSRSWALTVFAVGSVALSTVAYNAVGQTPQKFGIDKRTPWTTSKVIGSPEPPPPYKTERVYPRIKFFEPLDIEQPAGSNRFFVAERKGKVFSFEHKSGADKADLVLDLPETGLYAMTFHPKFAENGFMYVSYIPNPGVESPKGSRLARFTVKKTDPPTVDRASETVIFEWPNGGHNGGCLKFGPDGMLYLATGDGSGIADGLQIGQDLSSVLGRILRLDVDRPDPGKNYGIPKDNPFVAMKDARPEIWAYGLRQPWRFSFDKKTGDLWAGEVGQDLWEMIYKIGKGGNYGWSVQEGNHPFRPERKKGPTPILKPIIEHHHSDFRSITGGFVYRGDRLKELEGQYIYGDFDTGRIWALRDEKVDRSPPGDKYGHFDSKTVGRELARTVLRIVSWGEDAHGELVLLDFIGGGLHRLVKADAGTANINFPKKLSETGVFASTKDHIVAPGVIPYSVNSQLWGDHALKERFIALPGMSQIGFDEVTYPQPSPGAPPGWNFPDGTVLVKTFSMEMERGNPKSVKRLETRLLHFQKFGGTDEIGDQYWRGYTYVWNDDQTDADLLEASGKDIVLPIKVDGKPTEQKYRFPSRAECALCHTNAAKNALGVSTMQMNRDHNYGGVIANQLATLEHIGIFTKPLPTPPEKLPKLADYHDKSLPAETRARSYLHSNCSHCHMKWGGGNAEFLLLSTLPAKELGILDVPPQHGTFDIKNAKLIAPGDPDRSIIPYRIAKTGLGRMPHIGSNVVDQPAVDFIREWIRGMK